MSNAVLVHNRQHTRRLDAHLLRAIARALVFELLEVRFCTIEICVVAAPEMTRLNETFLRHRGSTDVLAFDYNATNSFANLSGEIFLCVDEALIQAARYRTTWQREMVRYMVHGILHLQGYDDHAISARRKMKLEENRLLKVLAKKFQFSDLDRELLSQEENTKLSNAIPRPRP